MPLIAYSDTVRRQLSGGYVSRPVRFSDVTRLPRVPSPYVSTEVNSDNSRNILICSGTPTLGMSKDEMTPDGVVFTSDLHLSSLPATE